MGTSIELAPWTTIKSTTAGNTGDIQELDQWIDTGRYTSGVLQAEVLLLSGVTLEVEGCDVQGGSFTTHASFTTGASVASLVYLTSNAPYGATERLSKLMRWKLTASGDWEASFRLTVVLK